MFPSLVALKAFSAVLQTALLCGVGTAVAYLVVVATVGARLRGFSFVAVALIAAGSAVLAALLIAAKLLLH